MMKDLLFLRNLSTAGGLRAFSRWDAGNGCLWCFHEESVIKFQSSSMRFITCPAHRNYFWVLKGLWDTLITSAGWGGEPLNGAVSPQSWRDILFALAKALSCLSWFVFSSRNRIRNSMSQNILCPWPQCLLQTSQWHLPSQTALVSPSSLPLYLNFLSLPKKSF